MIIGTALPLALRSCRMLAEAAPRGMCRLSYGFIDARLTRRERTADIDLKGVQSDVAAVEGVKGVHVRYYSMDFVLLQVRLHSG